MESKQFRDYISLRLPGDAEQDHHPDSLVKEDFKLYTMDISYFSGKLEMYMRYKELKFQRLEPHLEEFDAILFGNTGTEQCPQLYDCRAHIPHSMRWLRDTVSICCILSHGVPDLVFVAYIMYCRLPLLNI